MLSIKITVFLMLPILSIFGGIRKLRSLKLELVIEATVYVIFWQFKGFWYKCIGVLRFSILQTYSIIFRVIIAKITMIEIFGDTNWKILIILNLLQNFLQPYIKWALLMAIQTSRLQNILNLFLIILNQNIEVGWKRISGNAKTTK